MMRVLMDTNVILDIAIGREPHFSDSSSLFKKLDRDKISGFVTVTTITDIYYIAKRILGHQGTLDFIINLIEVIDVLEVNREILIISLSSRFPDFEDAIQSFVSLANKLDYIITRNQKDYINSEIKAISPKDFLELFVK